MPDIRYIKENSNLVKENLKKRFQENKIPLIDKVITGDTEWRKLKGELDQLRHERNSLSDSINKAKKQKNEHLARSLIEKAKDLPGKIIQTEEKTKAHETEIREILNQIPNMLHKSVPIGKDESQNKPRKKHGTPKKFNFKIKNHVELIEQLGIADFDSSARTSGKGFYYLQGKLAILNQALMRFAVDYMLKKKYTLVETPLMLRKKVVDGVVSFEDFQDMIYKIDGEDLYLIGTAEHSLIGKYINQVIPEEKLPIKLVAVSSCFRKEIGSHGINEKGLWRTHQFNKVEQIVICKPKESYKYFDELLKNSIDIYKKLNIPIRELEFCSGDIGDLKAKQIDIETFRPTTNHYEEVGSCSNLTDAQSKLLNLKSVNKKGERFFPHTLNNTALATSRAMVAILENYQLKDGSIKVPTVLQKYTSFKKIEKEK
ncbi:MAG: serine--tRNA ligase [Candidatus Woesearchaeota archaeon]